MEDSIERMDKGKDGAREGGREYGRMTRRCEDGRVEK